MRCLLIFAVLCLVSLAGRLRADGVGLDSADPATVASWVNSPAADAALRIPGNGRWLRLRMPTDPASCANAAYVARAQAGMAALKKAGWKLCVIVQWGNWPSGSRPGGHLPLDLREAYNQFRLVGKLYGPWVDAWEIDNEPDIGFVPENAETYAAYLKTAYAALGDEQYLTGMEGMKGMEGMGGGTAADLVPQDSSRGKGCPRPARESHPVLRTSPSHQSLSSPPSLLNSTSQHIPSIPFIPVKIDRVLMAPLSLPPGPWFETFLRNDGLSYTDGFNFHYYGFAADLGGDYGMFLSAVGGRTLLNRDGGDGRDGLPGCGSSLEPSTMPSGSPRLVPIQAIKPCPPKIQSIPFIPFIPVNNQFNPSLPSPPSLLNPSFHAAGLSFIPSDFGLSKPAPWMKLIGAKVGPWEASPAMAYVLGSHEATWSSGKSKRWVVTVPRPSPIVIDVIAADGMHPFKQYSGYWIEGEDGHPGSYLARASVVVYNFSDETVTGQLLLPKEFINRDGGDGRVREDEPYLTGMEGMKGMGTSGGSGPLCNGSSLNAGQLRGAVHRPHIQSETNHSIPSIPSIPVHSTLAPSFSSPPSLLRPVSLPIFMTEFGYAMLSKPASWTIQGRVRQWMWFRDAVAQIHQLGIEGAMAFYVPPYFESGLFEFGLAMDPNERSGERGARSENWSAVVPVKPKETKLSKAELEEQARAVAKQRAEVLRAEAERQERSREYRAGETDLTGMEGMKGMGRDEPIFNRDKGDGRDGVVESRAVTESLDRTHVSVRAEAEITMPKSEDHRTHPIPPIPFIPVNKASAQLSLAPHSRTVIPVWVAFDGRRFVGRDITIRFVPEKQGFNRDKGDGRDGSSGPRADLELSANPGRQRSPASSNFTELRSPKKTIPPIPFIPVNSTSAPVPPAVWASRLWPDADGMRCLTVANLLVPANASEINRRALEAVPRVREEPPRLATGPGYGTPGVKIEALPDGWRITVERNEPDPKGGYGDLYPWFAEIPWPDGQAFPAGAMLSFLYASPNAGSSGAGFDFRIRTANGDLFGVMPPIVAHTYVLTYQQARGNFTPVYYGRMNLPWRFRDNRPVALVFQLRPRHLPAVYEIRSPRLVRYER